MSKFLDAIWRYRGFIYSSVKREFQLKYKNSLLGVAWTVLNPFAMIVVYTVIFSEVMRAKLPGVSENFSYSIYLCAGLLPWGLFTEIVNRGQNIFLENSGLIKKINFPRICLPIISVINSIINFLIIYALFLLFLILFGFWPGKVFLGIFPVMIVLVLFSTGLGITIGVLNVFFRDVGQIFGIALQFWFWLTPVVYSYDILPEKIKPLMKLNPVFHILHACQDVFLNKKWPAWIDMIYPAILGILLCIVGLYLFRQHSGEMVDEL